LKQNTLVTGEQIPSFSSGPDAVRVRHREFIGDILSSANANGFQLQSFPLNPGLYQTFPWLYQLCASTFQQYRINGMVFEFKSTSSEYSTATNLGYFVMATDYDSADAAFSNKQQMENTQFGVSCKPSQCMLHPIECARIQTAVENMYIRVGSIPANADLRLYDWGKFYVGTGGVTPTSVVLGELWVSYDITFEKAILQLPFYSTPAAHYSMGTSIAVPIATPVVLQLDTIGLTVTGTTIVFPPILPLNSLWFVACAWNVLVANDAAVNNVVFTPSNGLSAYNMFQSETTDTFYAANPSPYGAAVKAHSQGYMFKYTGGGTVAAPPTITLALGATWFANAITTGDVFVVGTNGSIF